MVNRVADVDRAGLSWMIRQQEVLGLLGHAKVVAGAEVSRTFPEQCVGGERVIAATGAELYIIDGATAHTPGGVGVERVS